MHDFCSSGWFVIRMAWTKENHDGFFTLSCHRLGSDCQSNNRMDVVFWTIVVINCHCIHDGFTKYVIIFKNQLTKSHFQTFVYNYFSDVYIAETVHPDIRATLASVPGFAMSAGLSVIWILRYFWSSRIVAYIAAVPPSLCLIMFCFLPETPYWLIGKV